MQRLFTLNSGVDLQPFSRFLWQQGVPHRISEEQGQQVFWLEHSEQAVQVHEWLSQWQSGELELSQVASQTRPSAGGYRWYLSLKSFPVSWFFLLLCSLVALWTGLGQNLDNALDLFLLTPERQGSEVVGFLGMSETLAGGQWWRLFTPALLHFGWMHLVFNMLWLHELGKRIEPRFGSLFMLLLIFSSGIASNLIQYGYGGGSPFFGGFSGIVYALLGFIWVYQWRKPGVSFQLPAGVIGFMMIWLLLGFAGVFDQLFGPMANAAHAGGLLVGALSGFLTALLNLKKNR